LLKPARMEKIAVVGLREERQKVVSILYDLGAIQIEPLSKSSQAYLRAELETDDTRGVSQELLRIRSLKSALPPTPAEEKRGFASFAEVMQTSKSIDIDEEVSRLKQSQDQLSLRLDELRNRIELVSNLSFINGDLSILDLESATSFFGVLPQKSYQQLLSSLAPMQGVMPYSSGTDMVHLVVVVPKADLEKFGAIVQKADLRLQPIPPMTGKPADVLSALSEEKRLKEAELVETSSQLRLISEKHYGLMSSVEEQLSIEAKKLEVLNNFGFTDNTFVLEGWVPRRRLPEFKEILTSHASSSTFFTIEQDTKPPTLMETPKRLKFFESFIRFYAIPQSNEVDPSIIFAFAFPVFFGLMLGDVGYAVAILLISIWIIRRVNHPDRKTLVPLMLRSFASKILKPVQFRKLAMAMILGSLVGIVMGFLVNAYFGFQLNQYLFTYLNANLHLGLPSNGTFLDPLSTSGLKTLLLYSGYIGLFMVSLGLVLGMVNGYWMKERRHIVGKMGWLFEAWGIALIGLTMLHHGTLSPTSNPLAGVYIGMAVAGLALIAYGEGPQSLVELPTIISHMISYTRLLGILLASFVLAYVIDKEAVGTSAAPGLMLGGVGLAIGGIVLLVAGHLFNLVLGILEPGIQGARLIYVEHFSKYLHGGGRAFTPFKGSRTFTTSELELMGKKKQDSVPVIS